MTERKREVVALCRNCWTECGYQEELTPGRLGPHQCRRCGKVCKQQGADFRVVWYPPAQRGELTPPICVTCGYPRDLNGTERHNPLCSLVRELRRRVESLEAERSRRPAVR